MTQRRVSSEPRQYWSRVDLLLLNALYPVLPTVTVAKIIGRSVASVYNTAQKLDIHKSQEFLNSSESGRLRKGMTRPGTEATQFKPGHVPANKGLRRPGWAPGRMAETQFKKGRLSGAAAANWKPIGTILPDPEGYLRIKVRDAVHGKEPTGFGNTKVWPLLNRHVWEQHHGPIPKSHNVIFKDGDRSNCAIENLELVSRADMARRNSMWTNYPRELAEAIQLAGALKRKLRNLDAKKQNN